MQQLLIVFLVLGVTLLPYHPVDAVRNSCWAPPDFYGGTCRSSTSVFGRPGHRITYSLKQVNNVKTEICCQAFACGPTYFLRCSSGFRMFDIGCSTGSISATMPWGNNVATPAIKCKGIPFGTAIEWSH